MAARTRKVMHDDLTRKKIRTSQLLNRLQDHVFGKGDEPVDVSQTQLKAIEILLRKVLPDLQAVDLKGSMKTENYVVNGAPMSEQDWAREHAADE